MKINKEFTKEELINYLVDVIELILSTILGLFLGLNFKVFLDMYFALIYFINKSFVWMLISVIGLACISEFIINKIPEFISDLLYMVISKFKVKKDILKCKINKIIYCLCLTKMLNYIFIIGMTSLFVIAIFTYDDKDKDLAVNNLHTYKISENIANQIISSEYIQYFIRRNETYNGMRMTDAMEIDQTIKSEALAISEKGKTDLDKIRLIYHWVGTNIEYDEYLADSIKDRNIKNTYGAKKAFYEKKGVCFEFATLFAAMVDSIGMKTKVVIGDAYNGDEFGPHAWNEVYIKDEQRWISVDATFWGLNSSFDSKYFNDIHIKNKVAWEN